MMKIKEYRILKGWTQTEVAKMVGLKKSQISNIERGIKRPSPEVAAKIEILTDGAVPFKSQLLGE